MIYQTLIGSFWVQTQWECFAKNLAVVTQINGKLSKFQEKWLTRLPPDSPTVGVNTANDIFLSFALLYHCKKFDVEFPKGLPIEGEAPHLQRATSES